MKRAVPAIALSAAGLTWLLHAQGVIDTKAVRTTASPTTPPADAPPSTDTPDTTEPSEHSTTPPRTAPPTTRPSSSNRTVDGPVVDTRYGPVQVEVDLAGGRIANIKALEYPNEARRSQFISDQALPLLHNE